MSYVERYLRCSTEELNKDALEEFIKSAVEESLTLDYKSIEKFEDPGGVSKGVSAMANSAGGLLILGVRELQEKDERGNPVRIKPGGITWGPKAYRKEDLENRLIATVQPPVANLRILPIRNEEQKVVFLLDIPESELAPHMADDKRCYIRLNFQNYPMEHYQVAALFGKRSRPSLKLLFHVSNVSSIDKKWQFRLRVTAINEGRVAARYATVQIRARRGAFRAMTGFVDSTQSLSPDSKVPIAQITLTEHVIYTEIPFLIGTIDLELIESVELYAMVVADEMPARALRFTIGEADVQRVVQQAGEGSDKLIELMFPANRSESPRSTQSQ